MTFGKKEVQEIIKLDNTNDNLKNGDKNDIEVNLNSKEGDLKKYLNILEGQKKLLKDGKEVLDSNGLVKSLREVLYEIAFLEDTQNSLADLKSDIEKGKELDISTISKYYLSNYESLPIGESYGIIKEYKDISSLGLGKDIIEFNGFKIKGYINYVSIVDGDINEKKLVILDSEKLNKDDNVSDKVIYSISDEGKLILEENFQIEDGVYINENRGKTTDEQDKKDLDKLKKEVPNHKEKGEIVDEDIEAKLEEEIKKLPKIKDSVVSVFEKLSNDEGIDNSMIIEESKNGKESIVSYISIYDLLSLEEFDNDMSLATTLHLQDIKGDDQKILLDFIQERKEQLINIGGERADLLNISLEELETYLGKKD